MPPVTDTPFTSTTSDPVPAEILPAPLCVQLEALSTNWPPPVASRVPVLVDAPPGDTYKFAALTLALIVPVLARTRFPLPTVSEEPPPPPLMVEALVRIVPLAPVMKFGPPVPRTTDPAPLKVRLAPMSRAVLLPPEFRLMVPALLMLPLTVSVVLFASPTESPEWLRVRAVMLALSSSTVAAVVRPITTDCPLGAPLLQLLLSLQLLFAPPPPFQLSTAGGGTLPFAARAIAA